MKQVKLSEIINDNFKDFWREAKKGDYLKFVAKGGRASAKSTHIGFIIVRDMMKYPITTLCVRKVGFTLTESMFEQLKECIDILGVSQYWKALKSPLQLIYLPRGNKIIFRGADDPAKIKSIKMSKFPLAILWINKSVHIKPT